MVRATGARAHGLERYLVRVGHDEREACISALLEHHVAGRLSAEEMDRRQQAAMEAVTVADLERLVADLPAQRRPRAAVVPRRPGRVADPRRAARLAVPPAAVLVTGTWLGNLADWQGADSTILAAVATGAVGVVTGWWAGRRR